MREVTDWAAVKAHLQRAQREYIQERATFETRKKKLEKKLEEHKKESAGKEKEHKKELADKEKTIQAQKNENEAQQREIARLRRKRGASDSSDESAPKRHNH